jgi:hypothetical protein
MPAPRPTSKWNDRSFPGFCDFATKLIAKLESGKP